MRERRVISYANVCSTLALIVALGGVSWAATVLPRNSVGVAQLKLNAVDTTRVRNGSLATIDLRPGARFVDHVAGGALDGTYPNPKLAFDAVSGENVKDGSLSLVDLAVRDYATGIGNQTLDSGKCTTQALGSSPSSFYVMGNLVLRLGFRAYVDYRAVTAGGQVEPFLNVCNDNTTTESTGDVTLRIFALRERR